MVWKTQIDTPEIHPPFAKYSHAICVNGAQAILFLSGQLGIGKDGKVPNSVEEQAMFCFGSIDALLRTAGLSRDSVVKITAFVTHRRDMAGYMRVRDKWVQELSIVPASTLLIVSGFSRPEFKVEIEAWAIK